jgi:hypothetical protein
MSPSHVIESTQNGLIDLRFRTVALHAAVFTILGFALQNLEGPGDNLDGILKIGGALVLILILPLGIVSILIIARYYRLYAAALVYAANLHKAEGIDHHQWFREIERYRQRLGPGTADDDLIRRRTYGWPHSWILYSILIIMQGPRLLCLWHRNTRRPLTSEKCHRADILPPAHTTVARRRQESSPATPVRNTVSSSAASAS